MYREMQVCKDSFVSMPWMKQQSLESLFGPFSPAPLSQIPIDTLFPWGSETDLAFGNKLYKTR